MDTKLTLTIYDIVTYLLPGTAVLLTLHYLTGLGKDLKDSLLIASLLVFGYLIGAFLYLLGILLFKQFYSEDYPKGSLRLKLIEWIDIVISKFPLLKVKRVDEPIKKELRRLIDKKFGKGLSNSRLGLFTVADTYVASLPYAERDTMLAKEGFFRSLTALVVVSTVYFLTSSYIQNKFLILICGMLLTEIFRYAREYNRILKNQQIYTLALIKLKNG